MSKFKLFARLVSSCISILAVVFFSYIVYVIIAYDFYNGVAGAVASKYPLLSVLLCIIALFSTYLNLEELINNKGEKWRFLSVVSSVCLVFGIVLSDLATEAVKENFEGTVSKTQAVQKQIDSVNEKFP